MKEIPFTHIVTKELPAFRVHGEQPAYGEGRADRVFLLPPWPFCDYSDHTHSLPGGAPVTSAWLPLFMKFIPKEMYASSESLDASLRVVVLKGCSGVVYYPRCRVEHSTHDRSATEPQVGKAHLSQHQRQGEK